MLLSSGIHSFPFKLGLPLGLPSTFLGKHGWVQYFCKAALREENGLTHKNQQERIPLTPSMSLQFTLFPTVRVWAKFTPVTLKGPPFICRSS